MRIVTTIALSLIVIGVIGFFTIQSSTNVFSFHTKSLNEKETVRGSGIEQIEISTSSADIEVVPTTSKDIQVKLTGEVSQKNDKLHIQQEGESLYIRFPKKEHGIFFSFGGHNRAKLKVSLPRHQYETLDTGSSSGDIAIREIDSVNLTSSSSSGDQTVIKNTVEEKAQLESSSGTISTNQLTAAHILIKTSSGDVENHGARADRSEANTSSGDVKWLEHEEDSDITVHTSSGETEISLKKEPQSTSLVYSSSSGEASIQHDGFSFTEISDHRINGTVGEGEARIRVESSSGDFNLR